MSSLRNTRPLIFRAKTACDSQDSTNGPPGGMTALSNLVPNPSTNLQFVPRPAATQKTTFSGLLTPGFVSGLCVVGNIAYGMIASSLNAGHDQPFAYNIASNTFLTVSGITAANTPTSPSNVGDWTPPIIAQVASRVIVTHPGFPGGTVKFGWFDVSGFTLSTTGDTHSGTAVLDSVATTLGVQPGMTITGANIPANTVVVSTTSTTIIVSNVSTGSNSGVTLSIAGGTTAAPQWSAGDTNIHALPSTPVSVAQFNGRAYYAVGINGIVFSDSGFPCQVSNSPAVQALLPSNGLPVTALGPLPLTSLLGGIVQSIIAFQGTSVMQQITGDPATNNLAMNSLPVATGTNAPLTIVPMSLGLAFVSPEGLRIIAPSAQVSDPIGEAGAGVTVPFISAVTPSRMCAAANVDVIRISVTNGSVTNTPNQEWWFDLSRKIWTGPHTFPASLIQPWQSTFILTSAPTIAGGDTIWGLFSWGTADWGVGAADGIGLWQSDVIPNGASVFTEAGIPLQWQWQPSLLPDNEEMAENNMLQTTLMLGLPGTARIAVTVTDDFGAVLDNLTLEGTGGSETIWGEFYWGTAVWGGQTATIYQRRLSWNQPLIFKQMTPSVVGNSAIGVVVGDLYMRYQRLGYQLLRSA